jgi:4-amino-4-deoxy-L-arabinose transferase-like glycosyltransferase
MKKFWSKWKREILAGFGILLIGVLLRLPYITSIPVFADEAIYIRWSQVMRAEETLRFLPLSDGKQPLFMWVTIPLLKVFSDPLVAGRMVSVLTGLGTIVGVFVLSYVLFFSVELSLISSFLYSISTFSVFFDRLALADSMLSFFGIWTLIFAVITVRKVRLDAAMLAGFSLGGALLTKSPAIYFVLTLPLTLVLGKWPRRIKDKFLKLCVYFFLFSFTYVIAFAMYNILRLGPNFHLIGMRNQDYVYPLTHILLSPFDPLKPFLIRVFQYFWILGPFEVLALFLFGAFIGIRKKPMETLILLTLMLVPIFASSEFSKTMTARYVYFSVPYFFVISSLTFVDGLKALMKKGIGKIFFLILLVFTIHSFFNDYTLLNSPQSVDLPRSERSGYLEDWTSGYGIHDVSEYLKKSYYSDPSKKIVVGTEGYFGTLPDGLQIYLNNIPPITVIGVGEPIRELPKSLSDSRKAGNDTYLVVNDSRFLINAKKNGLQLIASYPKAIKPDGTRENLLLFKLTGV